MNHIFHFLIKFFYIFILLLSGCNAYHHSVSNTFCLQNLKTLKPHYASVQHGKVEYYCFGKGSPILLIPGYLTDVSSWSRQFLVELAQQHQVIVLNNRNVGGSVIRSSSYETTDLANDIFQVIEVLQLKKPAVVGISMGGMIAQQLAVLHQDKLGQLILINTAIAGEKTIHPNPEVEYKLRHIPPTQIGLYGTAIDLFFPLKWKIPMAYSLIADRFLPQQYNEIKPLIVMSQQQNLISHWINDNATAKKIGKLNLPVLILNGEADMVLPPANSMILAKTTPNAQLFRWREGGHAMIYQYPKQISDVINNFIEETTVT